MNYMKTADFLGLDVTDRNDFATMQKVASIFGWGTVASGSSKTADILTAVKALRSHLGVSEKGKGLVDKMYRWVKLDTAQRDLAKEKRLLSSK